MDCRLHEVKQIHPIDVKERLGKGERLLIIDVREHEEVAEGMIPGAVHLRLGELPERYREIDPNTEAILVCRSGNRSNRAGEFLLKLGYTQVKNMMGGMNAWSGEVRRPS